MKITNSKNDNKVSFQKVSGYFVKANELDAKSVCKNLVKKYENNPNWTIKRAFSYFNEKKDVYQYKFSINSNLEAPADRVKAEKIAFDDIFEFAEENKLNAFFKRTEQKTETYAKGAWHW